MTEIIIMMPSGRENIDISFSTIVINLRPCPLYCVLGLKSNSNELIIES